MCVYIIHSSWSGVDMAPTACGHSTESADSRPVANAPLTTQGGARGALKFGASAPQSIVSAR